jgi:thioester reductase-like protein
MIRLGLWAPGWDTRIVVHRGDLARPLLGLSRATFDDLAGTIDVVYHAGADVNLTWPFERLALSNVDGTEEVLRLAAHRRTVPVHYVSTSGVYVGPGRVCVSDPLPPGEKLENGYALSKWQAEQLVAQACARGLPVSVYRPTRIAPDSASGACGHKDFLWLTLKACVQTAAAPAGAALAFDLVAVDYVSAAIVALSRSCREPGIYHLASERLVRFAELVDELRAIGYRITDIAPADWLRLVAADPTNAGFPLLSLLSTELASAGSEGTVLVSASETRRALEGTGIETPLFSRTRFRAAVSYLVRTEFLPSPEMVP